MFVKPPTDSIACLAFIGLFVLNIPCCWTSPKTEIVLFLAGILISSPETNSKLNFDFLPSETNLLPLTGIWIESLKIYNPSIDAELRNSILSLIAS